MAGWTPIRFVKAHADGNDFLLLPDGDAGAEGQRADRVRQICDRHRGVGADGVIVVREDAEGAQTQLFNADGSGSELSGNGTRCVAAWLAERRQLTPGASLVIGTGAGAKALTLLEAASPRYKFRAAMGQPEPPRLEQLQVAGQDVTVVVLRVGNPQCVVLGPLTQARLASIASGLAVHPFFPEGTNVELASVESPSRVRILIWERGVGPTDSSGTGACAAAVAAAAFGGANRQVEVLAPGGAQHVEWRDEGLYLTGWAELVGAIDWWRKR